MNKTLATDLDPGSHVVVLHRWRDEYARYVDYLDHGLQSVTYVTTRLCQEAIPSSAAHVSIIEDITNFDQVLAALEAPILHRGPPSAIVALREGDLLTAARLRERFDTPGRRPADIAPFLDKYEMLLAARRLGIPVPMFRVVTSRAELDELVAEVGWPIVVKPLQGRASAGVVRLNGPDDVVRIPLHSQHRLLAQRYVGDDVAHVDGYFNASEISPWRVARYVNVPGATTNGPLAFNHGEPTGEVEVDDPDELRAIKTFLDSVIPGLSPAPWVFHLELFLGGSGDSVSCQFLEVGCRPGGGEIPFVWREVYGVDLMALEVALQCGHVPEAPVISQSAQIGGSLLVPLPVPAPCRIVSATSMVSRPLGPYAEKLPRVGDVVPAVEGYEHVGGRFRFRGSSTHDVRQKILDTAANYEIHCKPQGDIDGRGTSRGRVAVIGGRPRVAKTAADLGFDVVLLHAPGRHVQDMERYCEKVIETDLLDEDGVVGILEELHSVRPFVRVLSVAEDGLLPSARVNEHHGLGGETVETVTMLKDKWQTRCRLAEIGLSPVRARVVTGVNELAEFVAEIRGPAIVKPLDAGGSQLIRRVGEPGEAAAVWPEFSAAGRQRMLAEEFLYGTEISIEAFSFEGRHTVIAMTDKALGTNFVEIGHSIPADIDGDLRDEMARMTVALLDAVGLREGPSHTEMKLTRNGPRIVESHTRIGGDNIVDLVNAVYGVDLERLAVSVPLGLESWDHMAPPGSGGAAIRYLTPDAGIIESVELPDQRDFDEGITLGVKAEPGMVVPEIMWSLDRVCGWVMATGQSGPDAMARCEKVIDQIRITTVT